MITIRTLQMMKEEGEKITMLTCYDASFAALMNEAGVEVLLIGDSLGMVVQGEKSTLPVTLDAMIYHTKAVSRGNKKAFLVADLPFGEYEASPLMAFKSARQLMQAGAHMVKLEGGLLQVETTRFLSSRSIPVAAHIGLTPQAVNALGGYRVQGRGSEAAERLMEEALAHEEAGASLLVLECVPEALAKKISEKLTIPTIGIGAGRYCDGQVLVMHDMLGAYPHPSPSFVKNFLAENDSIDAAFKAYVTAVKLGKFPEESHIFHG